MNRILCVFFLNKCKHSNFVRQIIHREICVCTYDHFMIRLPECLAVSSFSSFSPPNYRWTEIKFRWLLRSVSTLRVYLFLVVWGTNCARDSVRFFESLCIKTDPISAFTFCNHNKTESYFMFRVHKECKDKQTNKSCRWQFIWIRKFDLLLFVFPYRLNRNYSFILFYSIQLQLVFII